MTQKLTEWFVLSEQKPWIEGVYEFKAVDKWGYALKRTYYSWWDGKNFHGGWLSPEIALVQKEYVALGLYEASHWRGLSTNPAAPKPSGNRKVTRYVVMKTNYSRSYKEVVGCYECPKLAKAHADRCWYGYVKTIRFRSPEAA